MQWWRTVNLYLSGFEVDPTDRQKMLIILSYMKGDNVAGRFADLMVTTRGIDMMSFSSFEEKLRKTFQPAGLVRNTETALFALKQGKELVEDYFTQLYQLAEEAKFSITYHRRTIVNLIRRAVKSEIVEFVERNQPDLIDSTEPQVWETALVWAEEILNQIVECKRSVYATGPTYNPSFRWSSSVVPSHLICPSSKPSRCIPWSWRAHGIGKSASGWHMPSLQETVAVPGPSPLPLPPNSWRHFQWTGNFRRNV